MRKLTFGFVFLMCALFCFSAFAETCTVNFYKDGKLVSTQTPNVGAAITFEDETVENGRWLKGWATSDGKILYGWRMASAYTVDLYAVYGENKTAVPGENYFENSTLDGDEFNVRPSNGYVSFVTEDGNTSLCYKRGSGYASLQHYVKWEAGRKYRLSYRLKNTEASDTWYNPRYLTQTETSGVGNHAARAGSCVAGQWVSFSVDFTIPQTHVSSNTDAISIYANSGTTVANCDVYYDDLSLVPFYKISYNFNDGAGAAIQPEYTLDKEYTITSSAAPTREGYDFVGWSNTATGTKPLTTVTLSDSDITLYAIWNGSQSSEALTYTTYTEKSGVADGIVNINLPTQLSGYTTATLYYADDNDVLSDYTPLAKITLDGGKGSYMMSGSRALPMGATRICAVLSSEGLTENNIYCDIPGANILEKSEPLLRYYSVSDIHVGNDYWPQMTVNRNNMALDIASNKTDFVVIDGDLVDHGMADEYAVLKSFLDTKFNEKNIPTFIVNGNHELFNKSYASSGYDIDALYDVYDSQLGTLSKYDNIEVSRGENCLFYSATFGETKLIFLSVPSPSGSTVTYKVTDEQLGWLDEQLYDGEKSNKTNLVFSHVGLNGYIPDGLTSQITNTADVIKVLNKHPNTIMASGHTHSYLDSDDFYTKVGDMTSTFSFYNDACAVWLEGPDGNYFKDYSMGQYIEVYSDKILIKARQFTNPGKFISKGLYVISVPDADKTIGTASIEGKIANGETLTAKYNGAKAPDGSVFSWIVNGNEVASNETYTIKAGNGFGGKPVILRITLPDKSYVSCVSADTFDGFTVSFDANGGTGSLPSDEIAVGGCEYTIPKYGACPKKTDCFFAGWSTEKNAVTPMTSIIVNENTTLYAVYNTEPTFEFYHMAGWSPNGVVESYSIDDGLLSCKAQSTNGDLFFTLSNTAIDADKNKYLRFKMKLGAGTGTDCMFFATSECGFKQSSTRIPFYSQYIVSTADGMNIYEISIPDVESAKDYWHGTVTSLRYDVVGSSNGTAVTDYIMFTDKRGIYSAAISMENPITGNKVENNADIADGERYTVFDMAWNTTDNVFLGGKSYSVTLTLCPKDGFEFTTVEDILSNFTLNGGKATSAKITPDGNAEITFVLAPTAFETVCFGDVSQQNVSAEIPLGSFENALVFVSLFDADTNTMLDCKILTDVSSCDGIITVEAQEKYAGCNVRIFVLSDEKSLSPITETLKATLK